MSKRTAIVRCKVCQTQMTRSHWMSNTDCSNPNCSCPQVARANRLTKDTIHKVMVQTKTRIVKKEHEIPNGHNPKNTDTEVFIEVPTIQTFTVTPVHKMR